MGFGGHPYTAGHGDAFNRLVNPPDLGTEKRWMENLLLTLREAGVAADKVFALLEHEDAPDEQACEQLGVEWPMFASVWEGNFEAAHDHLARLLDRPLYRDLP